MPGVSRVPGADASVAARVAYVRPGLALAIAVGGFALTAVLIAWWPSVRLRWLADTSLIAIADVVVLSTPMIVAVLVAGRVAASTLLKALGLRQWRALDLASGAAIALAARAAVEIVAPTVPGSSGLFGGGPLGAPVNVLAVIVGVATAVLISPVVEELFFRGLLQRSLGDLLGSGGAPAGGVFAGVVVVAISTLSFVAIHAIGPILAGTAVPVGTLVGTTAVGLGCGTLVFITGRLGGALCAHILFNTLGMALLLA
ncbi:CPBP family intramembrane glutamic endopeptidase [Microbacterium sp. NPDC076911]|uniref:CPBP family intramembrane glutamic endopeptidase n=1 Tax=Microbacterium sp. NPDC076911 TaxID=3154958 RepID=UPI00342D4E7D